MSTPGSEAGVPPAKESISVQPAATLSMSAIWGLGIWSVAVAALSGLAVWHFAQRQLAVDLAMRPPIVVVDTFGWIKNAGAGDTLEARYADGARRLNATVAKLRARGALVIDASAVRAAPAAVRLATPSHTSGEQRDGEPQQ